jgi:hypothetical protein
VNFTPAPANDFREFIAQYFARCRAAYDRIVAIAGKWTFEDLIPGLSDFDTRLIVQGEMTPADWTTMSLAIGRVHTGMAREFPHWARNLEHLPGLNLTVNEMCNSLLYSPEFQQWTFYAGDESAIARIKTSLAKHEWSTRDEHFHLRKIVTYIGPYQRGIDPAINLGAWESKYPLHSRFLHYFSPPVQSSVSLASRGHFPGKLLAMRAAGRLFHNVEVINLALDAVRKHYELPELYVDPALSDLERRLDHALLAIWRQLREHVTLVEIGPEDSAEDARRKIAAASANAIDLFFESIKFCRLMRGRLMFYSEDIPWFDSIWLIRNELGRMKANFHDKPLAAYALARYGEKLSPAAVLTRLQGELLSQSDVEAMQRFASLLCEPIVAGEERKQARRIADSFDPVLRVLEMLSASMMQYCQRQDAQ